MSTALFGTSYIESLEYAVYNTEPRKFRRELSRTAIVRVVISIITLKNSIDEKLLEINVSPSVNRKA
ncbi:MAG: hypothetical protein HYW01_00125 [Deltaproteobacteria bacterium]|nr:hypothetical protein [Deltaproteobacteria bacterium]